MNCETAAPDRICRVSPSFLNRYRSDCDTLMILSVACARQSEPRQAETNRSAGLLY